MRKKLVSVLSVGLICAKCVFVIARALFMLRVPHIFAYIGRCVNSISSCEKFWGKDEVVHVTFTCADTLIGSGFFLCVSSI